jgi:hypothetical protein
MERPACGEWEVVEMRSGSLIHVFPAGAGAIARSTHAMP